MAENSSIEWTDTTWNPTAGCSAKSAGCSNCYAMGAAHRLAHNPHPDIARKFAGLTRKSGNRIVWTGQVNEDRAALAKPGTWRKGRRVFVDSMSDLFHENVAPAFVAEVWAVMRATPRHTYQVLTKEPSRMAEIVRSFGEPLANIWLGTSVEDQEQADRRIPHLLAAPAFVRFLSCEPLLGPVNLAPWLGHGIDWVIVGGESMHTGKPRPMELAWARAIRDQCQAVGVPFFGKQWHKKKDQPLPADLMVRQWPA